MLDKYNMGKYRVDANVYDMNRERSLYGENYPIDRTKDYPKFVKDILFQFYVFKDLIRDIVK